MTSYLDFWMIWSYAIAYKTVWSPESIIHMDFEGGRLCIGLGGKQGEEA